MANIINTRIIMRNDEIANWGVSTLKLLKGEIALGKRSDDSYEVRIGDGEHAWSDLSSSFKIDAANVSGLTYSEYQLSALTAGDGEQAKFQLCGKNPITNEWEAIGNEVTIPEVDFTAVEEKIEAVETDVSTITTTIDTLTTETIPGITGTVNTLTATTIPTAKSEAISEAKNYTDTTVKTLSDEVNSRINGIEGAVATGVNFIGPVTQLSVDAANKGWYQLAGETAWTAAVNGGLALSGNAEYIWSDATHTWEQFGETGNLASKEYVDQQIADVVNTHTEVSTEADKPSEGNIVGDTCVVKTLIAGTTDKYSYTGYVWNGTAWAAMDGNYTADNVYFKTNLTAMYTFGKYTGTEGTPVTVSTAGKSLASVFEDALTKIIVPTKVKTDPSFTTSTYTSQITGEIGTIKSMPKFAAKFSDGEYTYGPNPTGSVIDAGKAFLSASNGKTATNSTELGDGKTISLDADSSISTVISTADQTLCTWQLSAAWTEGSLQWNNLKVADETAPHILSGSQALATKTCTVKAGYYPTYQIVKSGFWKSPDAIVSSDIVIASNNTTTEQNGFTKKVTGDAVGDFKRTSFENVGTMQQWFWLAKSGKVSSIAVEQGNPVAPHTVNKLTIKLPIADGTMVEYDMFYIDNPGATANNTFKVTVS